MEMLMRPRRAAFFDGAVRVVCRNVKRRALQCYAVWGWIYGRFVSDVFYLNVCIEQRSIRN